MEGDRGKYARTSGRVLPLPKVRKTHIALTMVEFSHAAVLMVWVGSLAGFALLTIPAVFKSLPSEMAIRAGLEVLERGAFLGCGAGAFLLLTTLLMHLLSMRTTPAIFAQTVLLLFMTGLAIASQIVLRPRFEEALAAFLPGPDAQLRSEAVRIALARLQAIEIGLLLAQIAAGMAVLFFALRRWYRFAPHREAGGTINSPDR